MEMAEENLRKLQTLIDEGRYLEKKKESKVTLGELRDQYIAWCKGERQKTVDDKEDHLAAIVEYFGTDTSVTKIARAGVEEYKTSLGTLNAYRKATPLKPASINRRMATLKHLFSKAVEWDMAADNPDRGIKPLKEKNRRLRFLSVAECQALLNACKTPTLKQIVALALNTGMRRGELLSLRWQSISLRNS